MLGSVVEDIEKFPLIKLAKKLKAMLYLLTSPEVHEFPLIKLAKKLKENEHFFVEYPYLSRFH